MQLLDQTGTQNGKQGRPGVRARNMQSRAHRTQTPGPCWSTRRLFFLLLDTQPGCLRLFSILVVEVDLPRRFSSFYYLRCPIPHYQASGPFTNPLATVCWLSAERLGQLTGSSKGNGLCLLLPYFVKRIFTTQHENKQSWRPGRFLSKESRACKMDQSARRPAWHQRSGRPTRVTRRHRSRTFNSFRAFALVDVRAMTMTRTMTMTRVRSAGQHDLTHFTFTCLFIQDCRKSS